MLVLLSAGTIKPGNENRLNFIRFSYVKEHIYDNCIFRAASDIKCEESNIFHFPVCCLYSGKLILISSFHRALLKITPTCFGSQSIQHRGVITCTLTEITYSGSQMCVFIMCVVGVSRHMPPNTDHARDKYL
jgi:hypothetical protein